MAEFQIERADEHTALQVLSHLATVASSLPGCRGCTLIRAANPATPFILFEEWDSHELLTRHIESEGFRSILVHFATALREPGEDAQSPCVTLSVTRGQRALELKDYIQTADEADD